MKRPHRLGLWLSIGLVVALAAAITLRVRQASAPAPSDPTVDEIREERGVPVAVATAERGDLEAWKSFHGTVSGAREAVVRARTDNTVARVHVETGDEVDRGQLLVELSDDAAEAQRRQAETAYQQAKRQKERLESLHEAGAISDQEWEQAVTQYEIARDDLTSAREMLVLDSPLSGTVTAVNAKPGLVPTPGDPLVRIADLSERVIRLQVSASEARTIETDQRARLSELEAEGHVSRVALQANPATRLVEVEITFPPETPIVPGTLEGVEIRTEVREDTLSVPTSALEDDDVVWIVGQGDRAQRKAVTTGIETPDAVEITEGLSEGDRVVVEGSDALEEDTRVRVVDATDEA